MIMKKNSILCSFIVCILALLFVGIGTAQAAPIVNFPVTITQPDGTKLTLYANGDEYYNWLQDAQGYTVIQSPDTGYYVYAALDNNRMVATSNVVGVSDPAALGLRPYLNISAEQKGRYRQAWIDLTRQNAPQVRNAPQIGAITNLVVFIRFSDEAEFTDSTSTYANMFNSAVGGANSLRNYYQEVSYNQLTIDSTFLPQPGSTVYSYQDSQPRGYYKPYDANSNPNGYPNDSARTLREHTLLRDAINYINGLGEFPAGNVIDADNDGVVDSITFIVSGSPTVWSTLLWPHQWSLFTYAVTINGKAVEGFSFHLNDMLLSSTVGTGVLAHEMFHVLGAPDLYHYTNDSVSPVGSWDLMEQNGNPPHHMSCYMKYKYGHWIDSIPSIETTGKFSVNPLTSAAFNCYKIPSPNSAHEYFIVEYRRKAGTFESSIPGTGLLVYRINPQVADGNRNGPPDEVYIYRPGGSTTANGDIANAYFNSSVNRTVINDLTDPSSFLSNGSAGGLSLCNIGAPNVVIQFEVCAPAGKVIFGNAGVAGAVLSFTDGSAKTITANASGAYSFSVSTGWSGTVTPSLEGYTFTPTSRTYTNVQTDQPGQDYTVSGAALTNLVKDPSFEAYSPNPEWTEASTNFGTPLCTVAVCGTAEGTAGPRTGAAWAWFGGTQLDEIGTLSQSITIPSGSATLKFNLWIGAAATGSDANDAFTVTIDGEKLFSANATQLSSYASYTLVSVNVSGYADNNAHILEFASVTSGQSVNFHLDDISLTSTPGLATYTISGNAGAAGVNLGYTDGTAKSVKVDENGAYSITIPSGWSGTVTPSLAGSSFSPVSRSYTKVNGDQSDQDYIAVVGDAYEPDDTAVQAKTIQGGQTQKRSISPAADVDWVNLKLTYPARISLVTSGIDGGDTIISLYKSGNLNTPVASDDDSGAGYYSDLETTQPAGIYYLKVNGYADDEEISAYNLFYKITPCLSISGNAGIAGATLSYVDGSSKTVIAGTSGAYTISVPLNWSGKVTPSKAGYTFSPTSRSYASLKANQVSQNFAAKNPTIPNTVTPSGSIFDTTPSFAWSKVSGATSYQYQLLKGTVQVYLKSVAASACGSTVNCVNTPTTVLSAGAYTWKVRAMTGGIWRSFSASRAFTLTLVPTTVAPSGTITDTTPSFSWSKLNGATSYQYQLLKGTVQVYLKSVAASACGSTVNCVNTPTTVLPAGVYTWKVRALIGGVWMAYSPAKAFTLPVVGAGFNSQFSTDAAGWTAVKGAWTVSGGYYRTAGLEDMTSSTAHTGNYTTFTYEIKLKRTGCNTCANIIYFRGTPSPLNLSTDWNNGYELFYDNEGDYYFGYQKDGEWNNLAYVSASQYLNSDWNIFKITMNGTYFQLFANNTRLMHGNLGTFSSGQVGVGFWGSVAGSSNTLTVDYATLALSAPSAASASQAEGGLNLDGLTPVKMPKPGMQ